MSFQFSVRIVLRQLQQAEWETKRAIGTESRSSQLKSASKIRFKMTAKESPHTSNETKSADDSNSIRSFRSTATDDFPLEICEDSNNPTMDEFFQKVINNGAADNVACFKLVVMLILFLAALIIGNAAFVFTSQEINDKYANEVSYCPCWIQYSCFYVCVT